MNTKKIRKIIIGMLLCLAINAAYEAKNAIPTFAADVVMVNATNVNVRSQPNTSSKIYGKVSKGTALLRTEDRADGWSCIDYAGTRAYIRSDLITPYTLGALPGAGLDAGLGTGVGAGLGAGLGGQPAKGSDPSNATGSVNYIANKNTHKFHYPSCSSVSDMSEKNKWYFSGSRNELINYGYIPCKRCNP